MGELDDRPGSTTPGAWGSPPNWAASSAGAGTASPAAPGAGRPPAKGTSLSWPQACWKPPSARPGCVGFQSPVPHSAPRARQAHRGYSVLRMARMSMCRCLRNRRSIYHGLNFSTSPLPNPTASHHLYRDRSESFTPGPTGPDDRRGASPSSGGHRLHGVATMNRATRWWPRDRGSHGDRGPMTRFTGSSESPVSRSPGAAGCAAGHSRPW